MNRNSVVSIDELNVFTNCVRHLVIMKNLNQIPSALVLPNSIIGDRLFSVNCMHYAYFIKKNDIYFFLVVSFFLLRDFTVLSVLFI